MGLRNQIRNLLRLFALFTVLVAVALASAIMAIRMTIRGHQATLPNLVGVSLETAQRLTSGLGLGLKVEDKIFSYRYPAGQIVSQEPPRGASAKVGQHVHVLVSLGPPRVRVPAVVGETLRAAQITAIQRGLTVGDVAAVHWPNGEIDQVLAQDPPRATADVHSPAVDFLVSLGEAPSAFICPSFVGQPLSAARAMLDKAGLKVGQVTPILAANARENTILAQSPPAGSKIERDTVFSFQIAGLSQPAQPVAPATSPPSHP